MLTLSAVYVDAKCSNITFTMKENQKHSDKPNTPQEPREKGSNTFCLCVCMKQEVTSAAALSLTIGYHER